MVVGIPFNYTARLRWNEVWGKPATRHAGASLKPAPGRQVGSPRIESLFVHDDRHVLVGYGDWDTNDGPTGLVTFDPVTGSSELHGVYPTEAFETFRKFGDVTYALFVDPTGFWEDTKPFATYPPQDPETIGSIDAIHVMNMVEHKGDLWLCGSAHSGTGSGVAATWHSKDQGKTWKRTDVTGVVGGYERAHRLESIDGELFTTIGHWADYGIIWYKWIEGSWVEFSYPGDDYIQTEWWPWNILQPSGATAVAQTSTHWVVGTEDGNIFTKEID